ncbi:hypothetical protein CH373_12910 [Leptospira perolatii]|uniref:Uncharacterized protein n=1 Tax=Leptospira perolatii TaxID=2023191 RepID=A0A2M9ZKN3_9LEPT|nr:hypothetical protein [Leptospira perolatii]PJZ69983.1 hypothetical protein CH360_08775 [Leptospira perolatii]PJZ72609.1 hypothetical protein CH373_12910 [Leptospira perolatii]
MRKQFIQTIFLILFSLSLASGLSLSSLTAQTLDANSLQKIREIISETRHPDIEDQYNRVISVSSRADEYLGALLKTEGLRVYEKKTILEILSRIGSNSAIANLESTISDETGHPSVRNFGLSAYTRNLGQSNRTRVENYLRLFSKHPVLGTNSVDQLGKLRSGFYKKNSLSGDGRSIEKTKIGTGQIKDLKQNLRKKESN